MIDFNTILPYDVIHLGGIILLIWVLSGLVFNLIRWRTVMGSSFIRDRGRLWISSVFRNLAGVLWRDVLLQRDLWRCNASKWASHFLVFWGFIVLGVSTTLNYLVNPEALPLPLDHPVRILGNSGGLVFMTGLTAMLRERVTVPGVRSTTSFGDALFIALLYATGLTGFLTEIFSEFDSLPLTTVAYWSHLVSVTVLFLLAPYSKFIHSLGRSMILLGKNLERQTGTTHQNYKKRLEKDQ